ncbi:MAG TPA: hypothetical protein VF592_13335 [Sphingomonas sp.]|jgi:hypothetical protein|uniref:hypothetical protein n=1 Tax=Sphingomonas sp. TaxID=28214 RepID=UPI002EDA1805
MTDTERNPDNLPDADPHPDSIAGTDRDDRSDIEQIVRSRSDAVDRGEGGVEPGPMTSPGDYSGVSGDGGVVKNQDLTQQ